MDGLSRLPLSEVTHSDSDNNSMSVSQIETLPVLADQVQVDALRDPLLSKVIQYVREGWLSLVPDELKPYWIRRNEPTIQYTTGFTTFLTLPQPSIIQPTADAQPLQPSNTLDVSIDEPNLGMSCAT